MEKSANKDWPKSLAYMIDVVDYKLKAMGYEQAEALGLAEEIIGAIAFGIGGRSYYIPRASRLKKGIRNHRIFQEFNGTNVRNLSAKYELSEVAIYNIIKAQQKILGPDYQEKSKQITSRASGR
jgi:Mor family transcriptional regulator